MTAPLRLVVMRKSTGAVPDRHPGRAERPWLRPVGELAGLVLIALLFTWLHHLAGTNIDLTTANAHRIQSMEQALGIAIEPAANHWLADSPPLIWVAVWYYRLYYLPLAGVLLWLIFRHGAAYRQVRTVLIVMAVGALLMFWLIPMSPPRFAMAGIVDIVADHDVILGAASRDLSNGQNHFSAFPSMHVGWSLLCAYAAWQVLRHRSRRLALLVWLFPLVMIGVVIATGNHYVLDVAASVALLVTSITAAIWWDRRRRPSRTGDGALPQLGDDDDGDRRDVHA